MATKKLLLVTVIINLTQSRQERKELMKINKASDQLKIQSEISIGEKLCHQKEETS